MSFPVQTISAQQDEQAGQGQADGRTEAGSLRCLAIGQQAGDGDGQDSGHQRALEVDSHAPVSITMLIVQDGVHDYGLPGMRPYYRMPLRRDSVSYRFHHEPAGHP